MNHRMKKQLGVGLIEILVSLVVLAAGLLSVATLHVNIVEQSHENKTRSEAMAIAESRIEFMRNYSDGIKTVAEFNTKFTNMTKGNSKSMTGMNASFTRMETIADANSVKDISVYVQWTDKNNELQEVMVASSIAWTKPRSSGDAADSLSDPLVPSATGRARLGDGNVTLTDAQKSDGATGDGMYLYDSQDGDYRLVDDQGLIVLTLIDACDLDGGNCTDFVEISGRVYIDRASQRSLALGSIYVKASDAAYCQLYYLDGDGDPINVTSSTTTASSTGDDYDYFNYTCYLGGGWHGNIGLILTAGANSDKVCLGDPTSIESSEQPVLGTKRVYRGMTHLVDINGDPKLDANGDLTYYSIGVSDALKLPPTGEAGHDFVVTSDNGQTADNFCSTSDVMKREDSKTDRDGNLTIVEGKLFEDVPTSFYCLNVDAGNIDTYATNRYGLHNYCPFDPSDPPVSRHEISGTVLVNSSAVVDDLVNAMYVTTSDGAGNCRIEPFTKPTATQYSLAYVCDIYDWGTGWTGFVQLNTDYSLMACDYRTPYVDKTADFTAADNTCTVADGGGGGGTGGILTIKGTVTPSDNGKVLTGASLTTGTGQCDFTDTSYECNTSLVAAGSDWTGTFSFDTDGGKLCIDATNLAGVGTVIDGGDPAQIVITAYSVVTQTLQADMSVQKSNFTCP